MGKSQNSKPVYDLEERTFQSAKNVRLFVKTLPKTISNIEDAKQVVKSSGSVGSNYIEANESAYWLRINNETNNPKNNKESERLIQEANELKKIFSSIIEKSK